MNVVFAFIRENWKPLLKYSFYLIMPVCLIQTFAMNSLVSFAFNAGFKAGGEGNPFGTSLAGFLGNYGVMAFCVMIGSGLMSGLIYALMQTYAVRPNKLQDVALNDFRDILVRNFWKYIRLMLAIIFVFIIIVVVMSLLAAMVSTWSLAITIPLLLVCLVLLIPLLLAIPTYIFERDITFWDAIKKAWKLGTATMGGMLGLMIVLYCISSVIKTVTMLPWYVMTVVSSVLSITSESTINQSVIYKFIAYILGLIQSFGSYIASIIGIIGLAFQYFHAREKVEGVTIESHISKFSEF
jgi:hypothetical protein